MLLSTIETTTRLSHPKALSFLVVSFTLPPPRPPSLISRNKRLLWTLSPMSKYTLSLQLCAATNQTLKRLTPLPILTQNHAGGDGAAFGRLIVCLFLNPTGSRSQPASLPFLDNTNNNKRVGHTPFNITFYRVADAESIAKVTTDGHHGRVDIQHQLT